MLKCGCSLTFLLPFTRGSKKKPPCVGWESIPTGAYKKLRTVSSTSCDSTGPITKHPQCHMIHYTWKYLLLNFGSLEGLTRKLEGQYRRKARQERNLLLKPAQVHFNCTHHVKKSCISRVKMLLWEWS